MSKPARRFNWAFWILAGLVLFPAAGILRAEEFKKNETGFYRDLFDQNVYYEGTNALHLERLWHLVSRRKPRAADVNIYDEVPDSNFFTNRHGRSRMSLPELERGPAVNEGPDLGGSLTITGGKFSGTRPQFFVKDAKGEEYLLKFDPVDHFELATSAEAIASRFYYAIGYNVPQYTVAVFEPSKLVPGAGAKIIDDTGFTKKITSEKLEEYLLFISQDTDGRYRASAEKILEGEDKGFFSLVGRRKNDPDDPFNHKDRREIRALQIFSAWLNNFDVREAHTQDRLVTENGRKVLKHYLVNFGGALGGGMDNSKPPMVTHEYFVDYGETAKSFLALGLYDKAWQKRWREAGEKIPNSPAVGYFDNRYFDPGKFKLQLPQYAFKDLSRADALWAAKMITSFTDEDIRAIVKAGALTKSEDAETLAKTLIERRGIIGRYYFARSAPLDEFELEGNNLSFKDLAIVHGFANAPETVYHVDLFGKSGSRREKLASRTYKEPPFDLSEFLAGNPELDVYIRVARTASQLSPYVLVKVGGNGIAAIRHED